MATATNTRQRPRRAKVSTTIAPQNLAYLKELIRRGEAYNIAEALDLVVRRLRELDARRRYDEEVTAYYDSLSEQEAADERAWGEVAGRAFLETTEL